MRIRAVSPLRAVDQVKELGYACVTSVYCQATKGGNCAAVTKIDPVIYSLGRHTE